MISFKKLTSVILSSLVLSNFLPNVSAGKKEIKEIKETHKIYGLIIGNKEEKKKFLNDYLDNEIKSANLEIQELENKLKNPPSTDGLFPIEIYLNRPENLSKDIDSIKSYLEKLKDTSKNFENALSNSDGNPFNLSQKRSCSFWEENNTSITTRTCEKLDVSTRDINEENSETLKPYNYIISIANDIKTDEGLTEHINYIASATNEKKDKNAKIVIFSKGTTSSIFCFKDAVKKINTEVYNVQECRFIDPEIISGYIKRIYWNDLDEKEKEQKKKEKQTSNSRYDKIFENGAVLCGGSAIVATTCYGIYKGGKCLYNKYIKPKTKTSKIIIHKN